MKYLNYKNCIFLILGFIISIPGFCQYESRNGLFEVDGRDICLGGTIAITAPCAGCNYDFNDDDNNNDGTSFTYNTPGDYNIISFITGGTSDTLSITVHQDTIPDFAIYRCSNNTVELELNDNNYDSYTINWGDGNQNTISGNDTQELHSYASSGNYTITVQGLFDEGSVTNNASCAAGTRQITAVTTIPIAAITEIYPLNNAPDKLVIKYNAPDDALYRLQLAVNNSNTWIPADEVFPALDSIVVNVASLENSFYCFRISTLDACQPGNPATSFSPALCTQDLNVNFTNNEENILTWSTQNTIGTGYTITIEENNEFVSAPNLPITRRDYTDTEVTCNTDYCYTLTTNYPGGATVRSLRICGIAKFVAAIPPIENMVTQVSGDEISLSWSPPPTPTIADFYDLFVSINSSQFDPLIRDLAIPEHNDTGRSPAGSEYCYRVSYEDRCENISPSSRGICAIYLTGRTTMQRVQLNWEAYNGYIDGVSGYIIEKFDENGGVLETITVPDNEYIDSLGIDEPQEIHYRVTAIPNDGTFENSISNIFIAIRQQRITAPNAFIPDGGGENSVFRIFSPFTREMELKIFNRWGELIYLTNDPDVGWPGTDQQGNVLPQGTYIYSAIIISENGQMREVKGSVLLLRR